MSINFFDLNCQEITNAVKFGLCDDQLPSNKPAYIDVISPNKWIAVVINTDAIEVTFTAIDHCLKIDSNLGDRCDAMLTYQDKIIFVELKERRNKQWLAKGEEQLENTISIFKSDPNNNLDFYKSKIAYIANRLRPDMHSSKMVRTQKFKDRTGFILEPIRTIIIDDRNYMS